MDRAKQLIAELEQKRTASTYLDKTSQAAQKPANHLNKDDHAGMIKTQDGKTGTYTDPRDGYVYKVVKLLDGKWWFAENLRFEIQDSWVYDNDPFHLDNYGRLYTWKAAKLAIPDGWALPDEKKWREMMLYYGAQKHPRNLGSKPYKALIEGGNSGFNAQLGGGRNIVGSFLNLGDYGRYWSATEADGGDAFFYSLSPDARGDASGRQRSAVRLLCTLPPGLLTRFIGIAYLIFLFRFIRRW